MTLQSRPSLKIDETFYKQTESMWSRAYDLWVFGVSLKIIFNKFN